jgi:acylphosphatase
MHYLFPSIHIMEEKLLYKIHIRGYVQGVGFRWSAAREAKSLGITGFVSNLEDGSVYIEAEGPASRLKDFIEWCKKGPGLSKVESVETESLPAVNYSEFRIENHH